MVADVLGAPVKRVEDPRFITGKGRYLDDIKLPGMAHLAILRSPYAHANIRSIDTLGREGGPGRPRGHRRRGHPVQPAADGLAGRRRERASRTTSTPRAMLATDDVKWTGEGVAAVVAETRGPGAGRARADRGRLGAAARGRGRREGDPAGRAAAPRERAQQRRVRVAGRRQGRHRRRLRQRRGRRQAAPRQPPPDPEPDGGPGRHRLVQPGHRRVHGLDVEPDAAHPAAAARRRS